MLLVHGPDFAQHSCISNFPEERESVKGTFKGTWEGLKLEQFLSWMLEDHQWWTHPVQWRLSTSSEPALRLPEQELACVLLKGIPSRADIGCFYLKPCRVFLQTYSPGRQLLYCHLLEKKFCLYGSWKHCGHTGRQQHAWVHLTWGISTTGWRACWSCHLVGANSVTANQVLFS